MPSKVITVAAAAAAAGGALLLFLISKNHLRRRRDREQENDSCATTPTENQAHVMKTTTTENTISSVKYRALSVNYFIARECNYQCRFCFHTDLERGYVASLSDLKVAMRLLKDAGMEKMNVSGGEPFLKPKLLGELCKFCKEELDIFVGIVSNGSKITESWLAEYGQFVDMIAVSLDSAVNDTNILIGRDETGDHIQSTKRAARLIKKYGIQFKMNTTVTAASWDEDMNAFIEELAPVRWKVFQVLPVEGENSGEHFNGRDASDLWITEEQYQAFVDRHRTQKALVVESNETMRSSYLLLDEELRFLNCRTGKKIPSRSILEVGVQEALRESGYYDVEAFHRRDGAFWQTTTTEPPTPDIEDLIASGGNGGGGNSGASSSSKRRVNSKQTVGTSSPTGSAATIRSHQAVVDVLMDLRCAEPEWWTEECTNFLNDVIAAKPQSQDTSAEEEEAQLHPVIVVEGLDGVGKTTVTKLLAESLGAALLSTPSAEYEAVVRPLFRKVAATAPTLGKAFYGASNYIAARKISELRRTKPVVVDRWWYSTFAYHSKPNHDPFPSDAELVWPTDLVKMTHGIFLSVDEAERVRRVTKRSPNELHGEEVYLANDAARRERIVAIYRSVSTPRLFEVDTTNRSVEEVAACVLAHIEN